MTSNPVYDEQGQHSHYIVITGRYQQSKIFSFGMSNPISGVISQSNLMLEWNNAGQLMEINDYPQRQFKLNNEQFSRLVADWRSF